MATSYQDKWIRCDDSGIAVRAYYFPWGTKHIRYDAIRGVRRVRLELLRGRLRLWGSANPRYWASLDPGRPNKRVALILDLGRGVHPVLTPDDPDAVEQLILGHTQLSATESTGPLM